MDCLVANDELQEPLPCASATRWLLQKVTIKKEEEEEEEEEQRD